MPVYELLIALFLLQLGYEFVEACPLCLVVPTLLLLLILAGTVLV